MDAGLLLICGLTFVIHLIGTLAYSVRIAGTRTRRIAPHFRRSVVWLTGSRIAGTVLAQVLLVPSAIWIATVADWL